VVPLPQVAHLRMFVVFWVRALNAPFQTRAPQAALL
jgi:hypothetical protein